MAEYNGPSQLVECVPDCYGFVGSNPISLSDSNADNYAKAGNPTSELTLLNDLLGLVGPDEVTGVNKDGAGNGFTTSLQYFSIKKGRWLWFFENNSGNPITVALKGDEYSHWTGYGAVGAVVPVPAAVWLFGTALIGLFGFSRRKKAI